MVVDVMYCRSEFRKTVQLSRALNLLKTFSSLIPEYKTSLLQLHILCNVERYCKTVIYGQGSEADRQS